MVFSRVKAAITDDHGMSTEARLFDYLGDNRYHIVHLCSDFISDGSIGFVILDCSDGLWAVPYLAALGVDEGYEQLDFTHAVRIEGDMLQSIKEELRAQVIAANHWIERLDCAAADGGILTC